MPRERARDRGVGVRAADLGRKSQHVAAVHRGRVRGAEVVGDQDVLVIGLIRDGVLRFGRKVAQNPFADVLDVGGALPQVRIGNAPHGLEEGLHDRVERILGVLAAFLDGVRDPVHHGPVLQHHQVGLEDAPLLLARNRLNLGPEAVELLLGALEGLLEPLLLPGDEGFGDRVDLRGGKPPRHHMQRSRADAA